MNIFTKIILCMPEHYMNLSHNNDYIYQICRYTSLPSNSLSTIIFQNHWNCFKKKLIILFDEVENISTFVKINQDFLQTKNDARIFVTPSIFIEKIKLKKDEGYTLINHFDWLKL